MPLQSSSFISTLINAGPDAMSNLYRATFMFPNSSVNVSNLTESLSCRIMNFTPPQKTTSSATATYLGTSITVEAPGGNIDKVLNFSLRLDEDYAIYKFIRNKQSLDSVGDYFKAKSSLFELTVEAYKSSEAEMSYDPAHTWKFYDCRFLSITPGSLTYDGASAVISNVSFVYSYYDEY